MPLALRHLRRPYVKTLRDTYPVLRTFVGLVVVAVVGNAAEHSSAVLMATRDKMDVAINIAIESSKQIALFVAPVLVLLGGVLVPKGAGPLTLEFSLFEVAAVSVSVWIVNTISQDGESNWLEGAMLLLTYAILATAFFFVRP